MKVLRNRYRAAIIGAGPAGLAAAAKLLESGISDLILIEREAETGGILNQCIHNGFGLKYFGEDLTGPEFAQRQKKQLAGLSSRYPDMTLLCSSMVSRVEKAHEREGFRLSVHSKNRGIIEISAETVITATGCRERTRENIEVPGTRPAGIFTAGQAQNLLNRRRYSIGKRFIIQGSGDIGLIMARRLTLEGFRVKAVLERLPHLSGSIRNKVQCLDHFGIPLHLGRQITCIRGRGRVSSVQTSAVDDGFKTIRETEHDFSCDTVLFAAGLIPELETVRPAGIILPDRLRPEVNGCFETSVHGLFAAGNCLHINDLADSAAEEGAAAAENAAAYLLEKADFRQKRNDSKNRLPYKDAEAQTALTAEYFERIRQEDLTVCIVCPKGCLLSENNFGCRRGEEYFRRTAGPAGKLMQRIHTTVRIIHNTNEGQKPETVPAVSEDEVPVERIPEILGELRKRVNLEKGTADKRKIEVAIKGGKYIFNLCRPENQA